MLTVLPQISGTADACGPSGQGIAGAGSGNSGPAGSQGVPHSGCVGENRGAVFPEGPDGIPLTKRKAAGERLSGPGIAENPEQNSSEFSGSKRQVAILGQLQSWMWILLRLQKRYRDWNCMTGLFSPLRYFAIFRF